jgi:Mrp family chromosome partitioning ATPase
MTNDLEHGIENLVVELLARLHEARTGEGGLAVLVTSARPGEGKSFVAEAIARYAVSMIGGRVLLVDGNPDHPTAHARFALPLRPGLVDALSGQATGSGLPVHENVVPGLDVLTAGEGNTNLFLRKEALSSLFREFATTYPLVVVDGSVLQSAGRALLGETAGAIVVVDAGSTRRQVVSGTLASLHIGKDRVLGLVLNKRPQYIPRFLYRFL